MPVAIALPDLGLLVTAAIAFALAFGILALVNLLAALVHNVPIIGGGLASAMRGAVTYAEAQLHTWQENVIGALIGPLAFIWAQLGPTVDAIGVTFDNVYNGMVWTARSLVPLAVNQLWGGIGNAEAAATGLVSTLHNLLNIQIAASGAQASQQIAQAASTAKAYTDSQHAISEHDITFTAAKAKAYTDHQVGDLGVVVAHDQTALQQLVNGGLADAQQKLDTAISGAEKDIATAVQGVRDWAAHNEQLIQQSLTAAITGGLAGVATQIGTLTEELTQTKQCADPLCSNLSPFGQSLSALGGYLETGAIFALLAFCVEDPKAAAAAVSDVVTPMADGLNSGLRAVVGL